MTRALRAIALEHGKRFIGKPYFWGGQGPMGMDCSGLMVEILRTVGLIGRREDLNAAGLYARFEDKELTGAPVPGALAFFGRSKGAITHVGMVVELAPGGLTLVLEAAGGGSGVDTPAEAQERDAMVTIRPLRGDCVALVDPFA
jgi:cell wall-associated NlpC family hydrolase